MRDDVYVALLERLMGGVYEPGESLSIDGLSRELGVSQTPLREALVTLESTGLVEREARKGYRVAAPLTSDQLRAQVELRFLLEVEAVKHAFKDREVVLPELEKALDSHRHWAKKIEGVPREDLDVANLYDYFVADWSFHDVILEHCGNPYLANAVRNLSFGVHRMQQTIRESGTDAPVACAEHEAIYIQFRDGTVEGAVAAMETHLRNLLERLK
ncbi:GntR family transcriptional regulator [Actinotignum sp. GS-2025g]|uniref:GntR family transcriptional regulator n=1 Tax=Actinotignum TaxID=1653174 RepID=UPI0025519672|nr:GntR family transcriptional regulator [Actinotignum sanguinis]MDK8352461.1 GntR family transcriptional regulator [Actinotignum sanguinis]